MRVHEIAKELGVVSKDILAELRKQNVEVKSHMSRLDDATVKLLRSHFQPDASSEALSEEKTTPEAKPEPEKEISSVEVQDAGQTAPQEEDQEDDAKIIKVRGGLTVKELSEKLSLRPNQIVAELMALNVFASINDRLDIKVAKKIAEKHDFQVEQEKRGTEKPIPAREKEEEEEKDAPENLLPRNPVITFLGHVDHGKTSLLDKIRNTAVVDGESGGITQHIGAYTVDVGGQKITFLDTPGHAAFTAMRARGADLTDIAVIIIAADDGIMPQTKEAIMHAKAAGVAMIIAINKIDLPGANVDQVKQQLQAEGLAPEDWGGDLICASVSAQTGEGVEHFLEMILLQAEMLELRANPHRRAKGYVIEGQMESGSGPTANLLITHGTLNVGDVMLCGRYWGRVRALLSDHGIKLKSAGPATPVKCLGLSGVPEAGAAFKICVNEKFARSTAQMEAEQAKDEQLTAPMKASLENLFEHMEESQKLELKIILKADTQGSIEAISHSLNEIKSDKVSLNIILGATGNITENDVMLASASSAVILGFHTAKVSGVDSLARHEGVEIRLHQIIYEIIDQVQNAMLGLLSIEYKENLVATADVKQVFTHGKVKKIAGCLVTSGTITPKLKARVKRNDEVLYEGKIASLKHFQDEVAEMKEAQECGVQLDGFSDLAEGDILEFYEMEELKKVL